MEISPTRAVNTNAATATKISSCHSRHRMPSDGQENNPGQGNEQDIAHIGGHIGNNTGKYDHKGEDLTGGIQHQEADYGMDQSALFGNADTKHGHQDNPQGCKTGEIIDHLQQDPVNAVMGKQVDHGDHFAGGRVGGIPLQQVSES